MSSCFEQSRVVFPTPVGVFPPRPEHHIAEPGLPHARGGVSMFFRVERRFSASSPRPWGCFLKRSYFEQAAKVFPTPVGVFLAPQTAG